MGGGTTNVSNTGLGDDQYQFLADNQVGIGKGIDKAYNQATKKYDKINNRFGKLDNSLSGLSGKLGDQFASANKARNSSFNAMGGRFDSLDNSAQLNFGAIGDLSSGIAGVGSDVTAGFASNEDRFDQVDTANQTMQDGITAGFSDQATGFSDLSGGMTENTTDIRDDISSNFETTNDALASSETNIRDDVETSQFNTLTGQGLLASDLSDLSGANDIYFDTLSSSQNAIAEGQDGFRSTFDDYVDRYSDDTTLANQTRADTQTMVANSADRVREDLGTLAELSATGQANLSGQLGDVASATGNDLAALGNTVEGGFNANSIAADQRSENFTSRLGNVKNLLQTTGDNIDANTRSQYENLSSSFDDNGNLIKNSIDDQGNTINRSMSDQGVMIETKFDAAGNQVGQVSTDVNQMLSDAETYQNQTSAAITQGNEGLMSTMRSNRDAVSSQFSDQMGGLQNSMDGGFQNMDANSITQARDLAGIAATQGDLDIGMRQNFKQLSTAFDETGGLISNSIDAQGNSISRAVDANGNLLLRSFDATGNEIGNKVININRSLNDLAGLRNVTGANASMGNLSPAMSGATAQSGFASPFSISQ